MPRVTQATLNLLRDLADYRMLSLLQVAHLHFGGKRAVRVIVADCTVLEARQQRLLGRYHNQLLGKCAAEYL